MNDPIECPKCGEIELVAVREVETVSAFNVPTTFTMYECSGCGHEESS